MVILFFGFSSYRPFKKFIFFFNTTNKDPHKVVLPGYYYISRLQA